MYNECDREFLKKEKTPLTNECTASLSFSSSYIINLPYVGLKANSMSFWLYSSLVAPIFSRNLSSEDYDKAFKSCEFWRSSQIDMLLIEI